MNKFEIQTCKLSKELQFFIHCPVCNTHFNCGNGLFMLDISYPVPMTNHNNNWVCSQTCANMYIFQRM
jgi:hypothetical protein